MAKEGKDAVVVSSNDDGCSEAEVKNVKMSGEVAKKQFSRLWTLEDEITILKGMPEFKSKKGYDPYTHIDRFYRFLKKSLHAKASGCQLKEKIRRLKRRFQNTALKGKKAKDFSNPFDREIFELSKKIWGGVEKAKSDGINAEKMRMEKRSIYSEKDATVDIDEEIVTPSHLMEVFELHGMDMNLVKRGMKSLGASERAELEMQWNEIESLELENYVRRVEMVAEHARLILKAYNSQYQ